MRFLILFTISLLIFGSCKMGKNYEPVEVSTDSTFRFNNDSVLMAADVVATMDSSGLRWWELFKDPELDSLVRTGLVNNRNSQIALKRMEDAAYALKIQKADMWPQFDVQGSVSRGNYAGFVTDGANTSWMGSAMVSWEIDFWGKYRRLNEAARADFVSSQYAYQTIQVTLVTQIITTYYELLAARASLKISENTLSLRDSSVLIIQDRYNNGIVPEIDLNQAQIQQAIAAAAIPNYERQIAIAENTLSVLIGSTPMDFNDIGTIKDQEPIPEIPTGLPSQLLLRRPDILQAEQGIVAENARVGAAQAARFPAISLTGLLGIASSELTGLTAGGLAWNAGAGLLAPLFYFGKNKRRVEQQKVRTEAAILEYEQTVLESFKEVEDALISIETYKKEVEARQNHMNAALNALDLSKMRYDKGVTSYLEYLEQQRQAFEAQLFMVSAEKSLYMSYVSLYKALGGGWNLDQ